LQKKFNGDFFAMHVSIEIVQPNLYPGAVADEIIASAREAIAANGTFSLALSGGGTPGAVYRALTNSSRSKEIEWDKVKLFIGDERWVPLNDKASNYHMVCETLLDNIEASHKQLFHVNTEVADRELAVREYADILSRELSGGKDGAEKAAPEIDLVLLGLGEDGHIASLFPHSAALHDKDSLVIATQNPDDGTLRVSLAPKVILAARRILFLVRGEAKSKVLRVLFEENETIDNLPAMMIAPISHRVTWYLDSAAAAGLPAKYRS
jgi:6-phosphogluconolactonase